MNLFLYPEHVLEMRRDVIAKQPEEACGFVFGKNWHSRLVVPITSIVHSPSSFRMDAKEEVDALLDAESNELNLLAIYHSHPGGIDEPSSMDYAELVFNNIIYLIWFYRNGRWQYNQFNMEK